MTDRLRIGVIGLSHDHIWDHLGDLTSSEHVEYVGGADADAELRTKLENKYGGRTWTDWREMLDTEPLDAVYIYASNQEGSEASVEASKRKLHVLIEKPMAASLSAADAMISAAKDAQTSLMINWPFAWWPQMQHALQVSRDGRIGRVWQVKYRAAHAGPAE